jgi:hypothetical protein
MAKKQDVSFNIKSFINGSEECKDHTLTGTQMVVVTEQIPAETAKKRAKKETPAVVTAAPLIPQTSMSYIQENIPYATAYQETNQQLDEAIQQLNILGGEIMSDLQQVRASKTLRNKYGYINDMTETVGTIINSKISAIKEKNKTINDINHLEITRMKELKSRANEEDDNTRIASMYDAFINTPVGVGPAMLGPSMQDMIIQNGSSLNRAPIGGMNDQVAWEQSLSPAENRMVLDAKGLIETVVMYDAATGNRWFEVVDKNTRQPVPNVEKPSDAYIYELDINVRGGFAKDSNRNAVYPLIVLNAGAGDMSEY